MRHVAVLAIWIMVACNAGNRPLPKASGAQGEVLVVMEKGHWESAPGLAVRDVLGAWLHNLPQREHRFDIAQVDPRNFGDLLRVHRNLFVARIGTDKAASVGVMEDRYAIGQYHVQVDAPDPSTWVQQFKQHARTISDGFEVAERDRIIAQLGKGDAVLTASLADALGQTITVPNGFRVVSQDAEFAWLQRDRIMSGAGLEHDVIEGILIYHFPYVSDSTFTAEQMMAQRDSVTMEHVNGPVPGSYMLIQRAFDQLDLTPETYATQLDGDFAYVMRGLWGMAGAKMGGPFVNVSKVDTIGRRVICADGYAYAPQFDKREYIRQLEAICSTLRVAPSR